MFHIQLINGSDIQYFRFYLKLRLLFCLLCCNYVRATFCARSLTFVCVLSLSMLSWSLGRCRECFYVLVNGNVRRGSGGQPLQWQ